MAAMTLRDMIMREVETLPETRQEDVLAFVRFLKIGLADRHLAERRFSRALARARAISQERGITEQDLEQEVRKVRSAR